MLWAPGSDCYPVPCGSFSRSFSHPSWGSGDALRMISCVFGRGASVCLFEWPCLLKLKVKALRQGQGQCFFVDRIRLTFSSERQFITRRSFCTIHTFMCDVYKL